MKFALISGNKTEAQPGLKGSCAYCQSDTIAKCGKVKVWHWAHKSKISCDPWWENETEWHRIWKNHFPAEWQEITHKDSTTGERHIADIKTDKELVIEFQHSAIKSDEIKSREAFYENMVWVVDGTRLKRDYPRFSKEIKNFRPTGMKGFFFVSFPEECFPKDWIGSSVPIIFDFLGSTSSTDQQDVIRNTLWCLLPGRAERYSVVVGISRKDFVDRTLNHPQLFQDPAHKFVDSFAALLRDQQHMYAQKKAIVNFRPRLRRNHFRF